MIRYQAFAYKAVPPQLLEAWSLATRSDPHLMPESAQSLDDKIIFAVIAFDGDTAIGFSGLKAATTLSGEELWWQGSLVVEIGGDYVHSDYRCHGVWHRMLQLRRDYAARMDQITVCVSTVPTVQKGLRAAGARQIDHDAEHELLKGLCYGCSTCAFCPLMPGTAWRFD